MENAVIEGDLTLTGTPSEEGVAFENITVTGDLTLDTEDGDIFNFDGIEVAGEIIIGE